MSRAIAITAGTPRDGLTACRRWPLISPTLSWGTGVMSVAPTLLSPTCFPARDTEALWLALVAVGRG